MRKYWSEKRVGELERWKERNGTKGKKVRTARAPVKRSEALEEKSGGELESYEKGSKHWDKMVGELER